MRDVTALHPELQQKVASLQALCKKNGLKIGIGECLRTVEEQNALYAQGRTKPGNKVTNARGSTYSSQHQWGIAVDFYRDDGTGAFNTAGSFFERVGTIAKSLGLGWGGDWKSPVDKPHLYLPQWGSTTAELKRKYGTPGQFRKTWAERPIFSTDQTYTVTQACYLRTSAGTGKNTVLYNSLSETVRKKCRNALGLAVFRKGKTFRLMKVSYSGEDVWGKMKSGYWVPLIHKGKKRVN